jgi:MoaA/NifB/PqqE/SkfB family radical SAM enzyme
MRDIQKISNIDYMITLNCNYNCWYCHRHYNYIDLSKENIDKIISFINSVISNNFTFKLSGGEPTISPYFFNVIENVNYETLSISTNLSKNEKFLIDIQKIVTNKKSKCIITPTFHAQDSDINIFYNKIIFLKENDFILPRINFTLEDINYEYIKEKYYPLYYKIKNKYPDIFFQTMSPNNQILSNDVYKLFNFSIENTNFNDKIIYNIDKSLSYRTHNRNKYQNTFNDCYKQFTCINYNGDIFPCGSCISQNDKINPLFNILQSNSLRIHNLLYDQNIKCQSGWCCRKL